MKCKKCGGPTEVLFNLRSCPVCDVFKPTPNPIKCEFGNKIIEQKKEILNHVNIAGVGFWYDPKYCRDFPFQIDKMPISNGKRLIFGKQNIEYMLNRLHTKINRFMTAGVCFYMDGNILNIEYTKTHWQFCSSYIKEIVEFFKQFV